MTLLRASLLFTCLVLTGCGSVKDRYSTFMGGEDNTAPPTPLENIEQRVTITRVWETNVGAGYDDQYLKLVPIPGQDKVFVAASDGEVQALDRQTGRTVWDEDTDAPITGGPGTGENLVVAGTGKAEVIALSADTGEILWRSRVTSEVLAAPQVAGNIVVARTIDGKIFGLNAADGNRLWIYERPVPALTLRGTSSPVITGDYVIAGFDEGRLAAIELQTGKLVWETRVALGSGRSELERMVDIDSEPVVMGDMIYVATFQGRIAAISLESGRILWTRDIASYAGLCADETTVYVTDDDSAVWALDRVTGNSIWKQDKLLDRAVTAPENSGNIIVVGDLEGYLHWLDKSTGELLARNQVSASKIIAPPIAVEGVVYIYASDGSLAAYSHDGSNFSSASETTPPETETETVATEPADEPLEAAEPVTATKEPDAGNSEDVTEPSEAIEETETANTDDVVEQSEAVEETEAASTDEEEKGFFGRLLDAVTPGDE